MNFLEERIVKDGVVKEGNILKVDSFLNHQMDINLFDQMGEEFKRRFADKPINKIVTIEASGIGIACIVARHFGVPVVFAKKTQSVNIDGEVYVAEVESFTHKCKNQVIVSKKFLGPDDHVLVIDDFLANGCALQGLISIVAQAGGTVEGIGIAWRRVSSRAAVLSAIWAISSSRSLSWTAWTLRPVRCTLESSNIESLKGEGVEPSSFCLREWGLDERQKLGVFGE